MGGKVVMLKGRVFGGKTGRLPVGHVYCLARSVSTARFRVDPEPEQTCQFEPIANNSPQEVC